MRTVFIVDTDASVRSGLARLVASADLVPRACESVLAFIRESRETKTACAVLDVSDLFQCEPEIWVQLQVAAAAVPVIAVSTRDDAATRRIARALGAQAFFRKPVDAAALLDSIDWVMRAEAPGRPH
ncbi:MAG: response regulator [Burkholderiales bacterium]|nr:response regulator [Burkholderiales bacterium]